MRPARFATVVWSGSLLACGAIIGIQDRTVDPDPLPDRVVAPTGETGATETGGEDGRGDAALQCPSVCTQCSALGCEIDCADGKCPDSVACPPGLACVVRCSRSKGCERQVIDCRSATSCRVECFDGNDVCNELAILSDAVPMCLDCRSAEACDTVNCNGTACSKACASGACSATTCTGCALVAACP